MKHFKQLVVILLLSTITNIVFSCDEKQDTVLTPPDTDISKLVGTWDKLDSVRLTIKPNGEITAQRWVAADNSYANNYAVLGNISKKDNNYSIAANKSNLAHLWSSQSITKVEGTFELNESTGTIKFKNVKVFPENLDVAVAVIKRLSNAFVKKNNPTTLLPMEELTFNTISTYQPTTLPNIKPWSYTAGQLHFSDTNYSFMAQTPDASTLNLANNAMGQHVHVILNGAPYVAALTKDYAYTIPDGTHRLVAFASRSYHEAYKNSEAIIITDITVAGGNETARATVTTPEVIASRPKGNYSVATGETNKVLVDFIINDLVKNDFVQQGSKYVIRITIDQTPYLAYSWKPYTFSGLSRLGNHKIVLDLYDTQTKTIVKSVIQTFTLI